MIEEEGKCRAEAEARGLPKKKRPYKAKQRKEEEEKSKERIPNQIFFIRNKTKIRYSTIQPFTLASSVSIFRTDICPK